MSVSTFAQWLIPTAAAAVILATYFLRTRRRPLLVPSTYLWRRTIEDHRVSAPWRRLRRNLLLFVQLAAVLLAAAALMRPHWQGSVLRGGRYVFLIDNSASMSATDVAPSRLEEAKRRVLTLIDQMRSGDVAMVVSFARGAQIRQGYTDGRERLRRAVRSIGQTDESSSIDEALRLCTGRRSAESAAAIDDERPESDRVQVFIVSDGNFPDAVDADLAAVDAVFVPIGTKTAENLAITGFSVRRIEGRSAAQTVGKLLNAGRTARIAGLELLCGNQLVDARRVELPADSRQDLLFEIAEAPDGVWQLRIEGDDALDVDNRAWAVLSPPHRTRVVLVSNGNRYLEAALTTEEARRWCDVFRRTPATLEAVDLESLAGGTTPELIVFDQCRPKEMPPCNTLFFGMPPPVGAWRIEPKTDVPRILDVARAHPCLQNVSFSDVLIAEAAPVVGPPGAKTLLDSDAGSLAMIAPRGAVEDLVFGFSLIGDDGTPTTNWPVVAGAGFEQFVLNVAQYFGRARRSDDGESLRPGDVIRFGTRGDETETTLTAPDSSRSTLSVSPQGDFSFYATQRVGSYRIDGGPTFVVNLFDSRESGLAAVPLQEGLGGGEIAQSANWEGTRFEGWKPILLVVLALLLVEWYIYGSRPGG